MAAVFTAGISTRSYSELNIQIDNYCVPYFNHPPNITLADDKNATFMEGMNFMCGQAQYYGCKKGSCYYKVEFLLSFHRRHKVVEYDNVASFIFFLAKV